MSFESKFDDAHERALQALFAKSDVVQELRNINLSDERIEQSVDEVLEANRAADRELQKLEKYFTRLKEIDEIDQNLMLQYIGPDRPEMITNITLLKKQTVELNKVEERIVNIEREINEIEQQVEKAEKKKAKQLAGLQEFEDRSRNSTNKNISQIWNAKLLKTNKSTNAKNKSIFPNTKGALSNTMNPEQERLLKTLQDNVRVEREKHDAISATAANLKGEISTIKNLVLTQYYTIPALHRFHPEYQENPKFVSHINPKEKLRLQEFILEEDQLIDELKRIKSLCIKDGDNNAEEDGDNATEDYDDQSYGDSESSETHMPENQNLEVNFQGEQIPLDNRFLSQRRDAVDMNDGRENFLDQQIGNRNDVGNFLEMGANESSRMQSSQAKTQKLADHVDSSRDFVLDRGLNGGVGYGDGAGFGSGFSILHPFFAGVSGFSIPILVGLGFLVLMLILIAAIYYRITKRKPNDAGSFSKDGVKGFKGKGKEKPGVGKVKGKRSQEKQVGGVKSEEADGK